MRTFSTNFATTRLRYESLGRDMGPDNGRSSKVSLATDAFLRPQQSWYNQYLKVGIYLG